MKNNSFEIYLFIILFIFICVIVRKFKKKRTEHFEIKEEVIPRKVFQTWKTSDMPPKMKKNRDRMMELNPDFEYIFMDDNQCRQFIKDNFDSRTLSAFDSLVPGAYKADLWRYCVLYKYGGIYFDIKLRPTDNYKLTNLLYDEHLVLDRQEYFKPGTIGIYNAFMVQKKGSEIMKKCIETIIENVETHYYGYNDLYPTGPGLLGNIYTELKLDKSKIDFIYIGNEEITYNGKIVIHSYPEYREEAPSTGKYGHLWRSQNIYREF